MQYTSDFDMNVLRLANDLPQDTIVIIGKYGIIKIHSILKGKEAILNNVLKEAQEIRNLFNHDSEEYK